MKPVRAAKPAGQLSSSQRPSSTARGVKFELGPDDEDNFVVMAPPKRSSGGGGLQAHRESRDHEAEPPRRASNSGRSQSPAPRIAEGIEIFDVKARKAPPPQAPQPAAVPPVTLPMMEDSPAHTPQKRTHGEHQHQGEQEEMRALAPIATGKTMLDAPQSVAALHSKLAAVASGQEARPTASPPAMRVGGGAEMAALQAEAAAASAAMMAGSFDSRSPRRFGNPNHQQREHREHREHQHQHQQQQQHSHAPAATRLAGVQEPVTPPTIHPYVPDVDPAQPPSPAVWRNFLPQSVPVEGRELPVNSTVSTSYETWCKGSANFVVYGVQLRVLHYTSDEEQYFPCHASPADLAAHSRFFEQVFMSPASQELINHRYITVDLDIPQEILHMIVEALYLRSIYLTPQNVELILMVVRFMQLDCILKAIKKYVLNDLMPVVPAEVCKLVTRKIPDIRHHVIKYAYSADVSEDSFRKLLDQSLAFDEARDILRYKKRCGEFSCEVELLDCVSAMINKRHQLLPEVVDFTQMHTAEVDSVLRYCMDVLKFDKTDNMPGEILEIHRDFWIQVWTRATEVRLETGKGNPMCPRNLHFWKLPKSELQAQLQREIKVKPFAVDDVTYELELTRRGGEWMVKLVTPNEELLRGRKLETRCRLISLANKEYTKGDMSPWMIWRTDWLWHSTADKSDHGNDILGDWLKEGALEFESCAERWLFVGVQVVHDKLRGQA